MAAASRIAKEMNSFKASGENVSLEPGKDALHMTGVIQGPDGTPYDKVRLF